MRLVLVAYFDIGQSFGLGDSVFPAKELAPGPDIGLVSIRNPLGRGLLLNLPVRNHPGGVVAEWRRGAAEQVNRPEMEAGWSAKLEQSKEEFNEALTGLVLSYDIRRCELRIFAIGIVFVQLEFKEGIPLQYLKGVSRSFEFAAYTPAIARALHKTAKDRVPTRLKVLSRRPLPSVVSDGAYEELLYIKSFTDVILCTDYGDDAHILEVLKILCAGCRWW